MEQAAAEMQPNGAGVICFTNKTAPEQALNSTELREKLGLELYRAPAEDDVRWEAMAESQSSSKSCGGASDTDLNAVKVCCGGS